MALEIAVELKELKKLFRESVELVFIFVFVLVLLAPLTNVTAQQADDPPGRIAQLNYVDGTVTFKPTGSDDWTYAQLNRPLTTGDQLWVDRNSRAELHVGSTALRLNQQTAMEIVNIDDTKVALKVSQGTLSLHVRTLPPGQSYKIDTPNLTLRLTSPGLFRVDTAAGDNSSTAITIRAGSALAQDDEGATVQIGEHQRVRFIGHHLQQTASSASSLSSASSESSTLDAFDRWTTKRDQIEDKAVSARYLSREIPGYQVLDNYGTWRNDPTYGNIWIPDSAVSPGWVPYRAGHWTWIAPWGWTWIDDAPWGFAPFHYGRWACIDGTWAWVPGPRLVNVSPVYAPALVAFAGDSHSSWHIHLSIGGTPNPYIAWFPLGPGEPWRPAYATSTTYIKNVNRTTIINNIHNNNIYNNNIHNNVNVSHIHQTYINQHAPGAITAIPVKAFAQSHSVQPIAQTLHPNQIAHASTSASVGVGANTPTTAATIKPSIEPLHKNAVQSKHESVIQPPHNNVPHPSVSVPHPDAPHPAFLLRENHSSGYRDKENRENNHSAMYDGVYGKHGEYHQHNEHGHHDNNSEHHERHNLNHEHHNGNQHHGNNKNRRIG